MKIMQHTQHPILSVVLWFASFVMYIFSVETIDLFYVWFFRLLSLVSLSLIIGVNWKKGMNGLKDLFGIKSKEEKPKEVKAKSKKTKK